MKPHPARHQAGFFRFLLIAGMIATLILMIPVVALTSCLRLSKDTALVRQHILEKCPDTWSRIIELRIGATPWTLAHWGLGFADMPPEARAALGALRHVEMGLYEMTSSNITEPTIAATIMHHTDELMHKRGLVRAVGVLHDSDLVGVYLSADEDLTSGVTASVVVMHDGRLVLGSGRARLNELIPLLADRLPNRRRVEHHDR